MESRQIATTLLSAAVEGGRALLSMLWPDNCEICGRRLLRHENVLCLGCRTSMPLTDLHKSPDAPSLLRLASHHARFEKMASLYWYTREDPYSGLIHAAKYSSRPRIARQLGRWLAEDAASSGFFDDIDMLLPVPLSLSRLLMRGYNQTEEAAKGIADVTGLPIARHLVVSAAHNTQTRRGQYQRWLNARAGYRAVDTASLAGRHVAIVDDVLTTGATLLACAEALQTASPTTKVSAVTLAATYSAR